MKCDSELAVCAQINFENFERDMPMVKSHPFYRIAKAQLDEALGGKTFRETLAQGFTENEHREFGSTLTDVLREDKDAENPVSGTDDFMPRPIRTDR